MVTYMGQFEQMINEIRSYQSMEENYTSKVREIEVETKNKAKIANEEVEVKN